MRTVFYPLGGPSLKEECSLCRRTVSSHALRRCWRCKRLFCKVCITEDLFESKYLICLNCARRLISPKMDFGGKYTRLTFYLSRKAQWTKWVKLQFSRIEGIIGDTLPTSAISNPKWWSNTKNTSQGKAWLTVGWKVEKVDLKESYVVFTRPNVLKPEKLMRRQYQFKSLPEYKPRKVKKPSLTRIAHAQARLQNISRRKASMKRYRGKFKPRSAHEKRIFQLDKRPNDE